MVDLRCFHFQELQDHTKGNVFSTCNLGRLSKDVRSFMEAYAFLESMTT